MSYVYEQSEPRLWTVGFYDPKGEWHPDSDHGSSENAVKRVAWLNGSGMAEALKEIRDNRYPAATNRSIAVRALSPE
jgi:hypothetical protein